MNQPIGFVGAIRAAAKADPAAAATVFAERTRCWGETLDRAARIAGALRELGIAPGDRIAVLSENSDDYFALYLAVPWAGAVMVPLNCRWSEPENRFALADCGPRALFVSDNMASVHSALLTSITGIELIALGEAQLGCRTLVDLLSTAPIDDIGRSGDDLFAIFYTGGTTGRSKGVMLSHAGFVGNCIAMRDFGLFPARCRALIVPPLFHLAATAVLTMCMLGGSAAIIEPTFDPVRTLDLIAAEAVGDALFVPTMIQMMLDSPGFDPVKLSTLRRIVYGASPMAEATLDRILAAAPHVDFTQAYGMTEVSCTATLLGPEYHKGRHRVAGRHRSAGRALPTADVIIAGGADQPLPAGTVGEILVRGPGVMPGYWNQPQLTAETLRGGWMHTGDGGRMDDQGLLYVVDRIKDMIVSGGENIYSAEVEGVLAQHPGVAQVAVIGVPDARWGECVHAEVVLRINARVSEVELIAFCREHIAAYKCPRSVALRSQPLPLSPAGKVLKTELRKPFWNGQSRNVA